MDNFTHTITIFVATFPPLATEAQEIESLFLASNITFKQLRRSPVSITYLTTTDPSSTLDPYISDNRSCIDSFQVFQLDATDSPPSSSSCRIHYSFLSIKIPSFSNCVFETQTQNPLPSQQKRSPASPPRNVFGASSLHPPTSFRKALANLFPYSKTSWGSRGRPLNAR